jgi:DNA-binding NtrC family response regulator
VLLDHFLEVVSVELGTRKPPIPNELPTLLGTYGFPGNVRELRAMVFDAASRHERGVLSMATFKEHMALQGSAVSPTLEGQAQLADTVQFGASLPSLRECSNLLVEEAMRRAEGNQGIAAALLGVTRQALNQRLRNRVGAKRAGNPTKV